MAIKGLIPNTCTIAVGYSGDIIDVATGSPTGLWNAAIPTPVVVGTGNNGWLDGVGVSVRWLTALYVGGIRLSGRTFIVPVDKGQFEASTGNLSVSALGVVQAAAEALRTSDAGLTIYSRTHHAASSVVASNVSNEVSWLRSRRT